MRHEEAMERMLEAEPAELAGEGATPLATHVRSCERCRALGRRLLEEQARLARALETVRPGAAVEEATELALAEETPEAGRFGWVPVLAPLAAAAAVAALLLWMPGWQDPGRPGAPPAASGPEFDQVSVDVHEGSAIVFATRDPDVTIVWLERPEGEPR